MTKALIVSATAGSGKTTTLVDGINYAVTGSEPNRYVPSCEQSDVFEWLKEHINSESEIIFLAFNKSITDELKNRLTHGEASTLHSLGCRIMRENRVKYKLDKFKTGNLFCKYNEIKSFRDMTKDQSAIFEDVETIVSMCKDRVMTEDDITEDSIRNVCQERGYIIVSNLDTIVDNVKHILAEGGKLTKGMMGGVNVINFDDMIYLPSRHNLTTKFDVMLIDEAQDLSPGKLKLLLNQECNTYVFVGDPNQAIYAFAGADSQSFASIAEAIPDVEVLPLTYTYRCGKAIVMEAKQIVGDAINYGPNNPEGQVLTIDQVDMLLTEGDMLVSRINAPLMGIAWKLVKDCKPVKVVGRDIGKGLVRLIKRLAGKTITDCIDLLPKVEAWREKEITVLQLKGYPTEEKQIQINDQADCINMIATQCDKIDDVVIFLKDLFDDTNLDRCIRLSSIHRAKGLEADNVYFFNPANVPHPMAKSEEAILQEKNLKFVATTRAIHKLYYVTPTNGKKNGKGK
jgi:superfamily I DNA/RNA helicase